MNQERNDIPDERFNITVDPPSNRLASMCINFYEDGRVNLNGKLMADIDCNKVTLQFTDDFHYLQIKKGQENPKQMKLPKSGSIRLPVVAEKLNKLSITLPAKYDCWKCAELNKWQGVLIENPMMKPLVKRQGLKKS